MSYRDRLRAGGQGAFQRAIGVGLMPKAMKQEMNAAAQSFVPQQPEVQCNMGFQYETGVDDEQMWNGAHGGDWYGNPTSQYVQQMAPQPLEVQTGMLMSSQPYEPQMQQIQMYSQMPFETAPLMGGQLCDMQCMQMAPTVQGEQSPQSLQMQSLQVTATPMNGHDKQADIDRCMAIIMPQAAQFACDKEVMAAQLQAAANCQCYED